MNHVAISLAFRRHDLFYSVGEAGDESASEKVGDWLPNSPHCGDSQPPNSLGLRISSRMRAARASRRQNRQGCALRRAPGFYGSKLGGRD